MAWSTFYVLNGLLNGERGVHAIPAGGGKDQPLKDGHYYLMEDEVDGTGPFASHQDAWDAAQQEFHTHVYAFPMDHARHWRMSKADQTDPGIFSDCNVGSIVLEDGPNKVYTAKIEGSYETLTLTMSAPSYEAVADVFHQVLRASAQYQ